MHSRIYLLSLVYTTGKACDTDLKKYLVEQTEKLPFNDKYTDAYNASLLFEPFYASIDEKIYLSEMHSNTQFCVNRGGSLIKNITHMVSKFSFKISTEAAVALTHELIMKSQLTSCTTDVQALFKAVSERVSDP